MKKIDKYVDKAKYYVFPSNNLCLVQSCNTAVDATTKLCIDANIEITKGYLRYDMDILGKTTWYCDATLSTNGAPT
jgi:hypothetical protein